MSGPIAVSIEELKKFGCPSCGYRSGSTPISGGGAVIWQCGDSDCGESCVGLVEGLTKSPIGLGGEDETIYPELQKHPRHGIPSHGTPDKKPESGGEFFGSRGIGLEYLPACFVCGGKDSLYNNISAFAQCKTAGERIVAMFEKGAMLDYRDHEPDRIQVKIGACDTHKSNLELLHNLTYKEEGVITEEMIQQAVSS